MQEDYQRRNYKRSSRLEISVQKRSRVQNTKRQTRHSRVYWMISSINSDLSHLKSITCLNDSLVHQYGDLCCKPGSESCSQRVSNSKFWGILLPERCEMYVKANFTSSVHLVRLSIKLWKFHLNGSSGVCCGNLEIQFKLILYVLMDVPTLSVPSIPL